MKIGVLIPDRNDRPRLLENCLRMMKAQTLQPEIIELVNDPAPDHFISNRIPHQPKQIPNRCDITWRYRTGYDRLRNKGLDMIAFVENDDWYSPYYFEIMRDEWLKSGKPQLLGTTFTTYYHIKLFAYFNMIHKTRSSAMTTFIKPDLNFNWCVDWEPYTDMYLWGKCKLRGHTFDPKRYITLGIKHGEGKCGGKSHVDQLQRYVSPDPDKSFLKKVMSMDQESFDFYTNYFNV